MLYLDESIVFFNGVLKCKMTLSDDGGSINGGRFSSSQTFFLNVMPVNQAPSFLLLNTSFELIEAGQSHLGTRPTDMSAPLTVLIEKVLLESAEQPMKTSKL